MSKGFLVATKDWVQKKIDSFRKNLVHSREVTVTTNASGDVSFEFDFNTFNLISGFVVTPSWSYISVGYYVNNMASGHVFNGVGALASKEVTIRIFYTRK